MATSAFKSSSRKGALTSAAGSSGSSKESKTIVDVPDKAPARRSRSVSAFSRTREPEFPAFSNSRDNPLFWNSVSPSLNEVGPRVDEIPTNINAANQKSASGGSVDNRRGRSVSRNAESGSKISGDRSSFGRSLSRTGRGTRERSVSRPPASKPLYVNSESEAEQVIGKIANPRLNSKPSPAGSTGRDDDLTRSSISSGHRKDLRTWSSQHSASDAEDKFSASSIRNHQSAQKLNLEDRASSSSCLAGVEEKTIKAVCEQIKSAEGSYLHGDTPVSSIYETIQAEIRRAISDIQNDLSNVIQRSNATTFAGVDVPDISSDSNPGAMDLVISMRGECAKKLEQSQDRARKLRADLAVEEYRGQELSKILSEILPEPNISNAQKSRMGRKSSIERRKMSKRLTEEAMTYFDECVSLSTFDSSDLSSQEDQPFNRAFVKSSSLLQESETRSASAIGHEYSKRSATSKAPGQDEVSQGSSNISGGRQFQFSFATNSTETETLQDFGKYVRNFTKDGPKSRIVSTDYYNSDEFTMQNSPESLLLDKFLFRNRIDSGSLLLCGAGLSRRPSPFDPSF